MQFFFADSKSRAQELSNDVSFVIFGHQTWDLKGGGQIDPPSISWFSSTPAEIGLKDLSARLRSKHLEERFGAFFGTNFEKFHCTVSGE